MPDANARGVTDVIGFTLTAALILTTISIVFVVGLGGLEDTRDDERLRNAERAFGVLADNTEDIRKRGAPSRATEIKLADARLEFGDGTSIRAEVNNVAGSPVYNVDAKPIVYDAGTGSQILYQSGALIRQEDDGGAVMQRDPEVAFTDRAFQTGVISVIEIRRDGPTSVGGGGGSSTALVRTALASRDVVGAHNDPDTEPAPADPDSDGSDELVNEYWVTLEIDSTATRAPTWEALLNERIPGGLDANDIDGNDDFTDDPPCELSGPVVTCELRLERFYFTATRLDVEFSA